MRALRFFVLAILATTLLFGSKQPGSQLKEALAKSQAQLAAAAKEVAALKAALIAKVKPGPNDSKQADELNATRAALAEAQSQVVQARAQAAQAIARAAEIQADADKTRADAQAVLAAITKHTKNLAGAIATVNANGRKHAADDAADNAQLAQATDSIADGARDAARRAERANVEAVLAARLARLQVDELQRAADHSNAAVYATLITTIFGFMSLLASFFWKAYSDNRDHEWLVQSSIASEKANVAHRSTELAKIDKVQASADAATDGAERAFTEANEVNRKIASIGLKMIDDSPLNPSHPPAEEHPEEEKL